MNWQALKQAPCPIGQTLSVIGERWTPLILRDCYGGVTRFDAFEASLKIPRALLTKRLKMLVAEGILEKQKDPHHARRFDYILTEKGWDLRPVLITMLTWGDKYMTTGTSSLHIKHTKCGHRITPQLHCPDCDEKIDIKDLEAIKSGASDPEDNL